MHIALNKWKMMLICTGEIFLSYEDNDRMMLLNLLDYPAYCKTMNMVQSPRTGMKNSPDLLAYNVHCSKNLREQVHCGRLLLKWTFLV